MTNQQPKINCCVSLVFEKEERGMRHKILYGYLCDNTGKDEFDLKAEAERYHREVHEEKTKDRYISMWEITSLVEGDG